VIVFGQIARDLVLVVDAVPTASRSADVYQRRELLGGKGANQAVGLAQLGLRPALAGVVGEDQVGHRLLTQASQDRVGRVQGGPGRCAGRRQPGCPAGHGRRAPR
jgi:ribokinase